MNKPFRVCLLPVLLASGFCERQTKGDEKKRSAANEGLKEQIDAVVPKQYVWARSHTRWQKLFKK